MLSGVYAEVARTCTAPAHDRALTDDFFYIYSPAARAHLQDCFFGGRGRIIRSPMATSPPLLARLLNTPDLAKVVPRLPPEILHRVIQVCGLEDSAEFVALATPAQLSRILDVDLWHVRTPGADEQFDVDRFGVWLEVLMQSGAAVAAEKLIGLDMELVVAGFSRHIAVFDQAAVSSYTTLDGEQVPESCLDSAPTAEIGGYVIEARRTSAWDAIVDLLAFLQASAAGVLPASDAQLRSPVEWASRSGRLPHAARGLRAGPV